MTITSRTRAILWGLFSCFSFSLLTAVIKSTNTQFPIPLIILSRSFFGCLFLTPFLIKKGIKRPGNAQIVFYLIRAIIGYIAIFATYYAYRNLPLYIATSIGYTEPMMQVAISMLFFKATINRSDWTGISLGLAGAAIMAYSKQGDQSWAFNTVILVALLANLLASVSKGFTKRLTQSDPTHQIMFYSYFLNFVPAAIHIFFIQSDFPKEVLSLYVIALLSATALLSSIANYAYTKALSLTEMHVLSPVNYSKLIFAIPLGFFLYSEIPTWMTLSGSIMILMANYFIIRSSKPSNSSLSS